MGLGSTAKKIQTLADRAEQLYVKLKEVHERVLSVEGTVEDTQARVKELESELEHQRVVMEALAEEHGIDVDAVVAEAAIDDPDGETAGGETATDDAQTASGSSGDA
jgi:predicted nuclease with TOPRIM domain